MRSLVIRRESIDSHAAQELIAALNADLAHRDPEPGIAPLRLESSQLAAGHGAFLLARSERRPIACGAIRRLDAESAEITSMYVLPKHRGAGLGRDLLVALEKAAAEWGVHRLVLAVGRRQPEALSLYKSAGYRPTPCFGRYAESRHCVCLAKEVGLPG